MKNLRTFTTATRLFREIKKERFKGEVRDQIERAALSVCLNIAEGNDRNSSKDRRRFFNIALTSLREVQAILMIESDSESLIDLSDRAGAQLYMLHKNCH